MENFRRLLYSRKLSTFNNDGGNIGIISLRRVCVSYMKLIFQVRKYRDEKNKYDRPTSN